MVLIERKWAMPSKHTFLITPVRELLLEEMGEGEWVDPYAGFNSPAEITNDLNPAAPVMWHKEAFDFLASLSACAYAGVLFDPPYSLRQAKECYSNLGIACYNGYDTTFPTKEKDEAARIVRLGGKAICCGWNSGGLGAQRGFMLTRVLMIPHGGKHNDTIVTVEVKVDTGRITRAN